MRQLVPSFILDRYKANEFHGDFPAVGMFVDISGFSAVNQKILRALKKYGMIVADNGSDWFISGAPDSRWDDGDLHELHRLRGRDFEAVYTGPIER